MKIGLLLVCTGELYWPYAKQLIESARVHFLPGKEVDYFLWADIPNASTQDVHQRVGDTYYRSRYPNGTTEDAVAAVTQEVQDFVNRAHESVTFVNSLTNITKFNTEHTGWPYPTLMRYHLFLQQEELLSKYDYLFYCDIDMLFVNTVGDEILGDGITAAEHPMYHLRSSFKFPLEPNPLSAAYVKVPQFYFAGGFQGGRAADFIKAMWSMKRTIDQDFSINYIARWNDESHWNRYLFDNPPGIVLDPSYVYPDSLIKEYYEPIWGQNFVPRLVTLTKKFSTSKEGGDAVKKTVADFKPLQI